MKQQDATPVLVGDTTFYIRPFPAFKSANIFGQLTKTITPVAGGLLSLVGGTGDEKSIFDLNLEEAAPALAGASAPLVLLVISPAPWWRPCSGSSWSITATSPMTTRRPAPPRS